MLEVLDTAGQEEYTALRDQWIRDGEGFVLVYSITSRSSFSRIEKFYHQIQRVKESVAATAGSPTYPGAPISPGVNYGPAPVMLVGNKSDRVTEREVSTQEGTAMARALGCDFVEASAKNCVNVERAFYDVVRSLRRQRMQATKSNDRSRFYDYPSKPPRDRYEDDRHYGKPSSGRHHKGSSKHGTKCIAQAPTARFWDIPRRPVPDDAEVLQITLPVSLFSAVLISQSILEPLNYSPKRLIQLQLLANSGNE
ncbi:MAG: Ras GTPase ras2 [Bogoriella megaspora]|nr:MAG: Ras GTPase ras2 [Bogoriella megaspora]